MGGVQGRRALLRRRLRDHPADAARRGPHLSLDELAPSSSTRSRWGRSRPARSWRRSPRSATRHTALAGGVVAAAVAFAPSFAFVLLGGGRFEQLRHSARAQAFLDGAGSGGDRRDSRAGDSAGARAPPSVAVRGAGGSGGRAAGRPPRSRADAARRGRRRRRARAWRACRCAERRRTRQCCDPQPSPGAWPLKLTTCWIPLGRFA